MIEGRWPIGRGMKPAVLDRRPSTVDHPAHPLHGPIDPGRRPGGEATRAVQSTMLLPTLALLVAAWPGPMQGDELEAYLSARRRVLDDPRRGVEERARTALEMASALDRAAGAAETAGAARGRWSEAAEILEGFNARQPGHPRASTLAAQAAIYRWAVGRSWSDRLATDPADAEARGRAARALDAAVAALGPLATKSAEGDGALGANVRYRLARALVDRARLEPVGSEARRARLEDALARLSGPFPEPALRGYADLLRAEALTDLGRVDDADRALDEADGAEPAPPTAERVEARVGLELARGRPDAAERALDALPDDRAALRDRLALEVALARWGDAEARESAESEAFRRVEALQRRGGAEARRALVRLAQVVDEPGEGRTPADLARLAEGALALGQARRASGLDRRAADRAEAGGRPEEAAGLRFRAAAILFRADEPAEAETLLARLAAEPSAGALRPRAALLRALALDRGRELGRPGYDLPRLEGALAELVRDFPETPEAGEARWRLGRARLESGDPDAAAASWREVPRDHPRWLDARLALAALGRDAVEAALVGSDPEAVRRALAEARGALDAVEADLPPDDDAGRAEVALARAELETLPDAGEPARALRALDGLLGRPLDDARRGRARRLRVVALTALGRYLDAHREARALLEAEPPEAMLDLARRLDRAAASAASDLARRRFGEILLLLADALQGRDDLPTPARAEARLRRARAELFRGDPPAARTALRGWPEASDALPASLWPDLAELASEAGDSDRAAAVYRLLARRHRPGSPPWFRARYGHALALERSGRPDLALRLLDATSALYPDLGGPALKDRFDRLRRRLEHH